MSGLQTTRDSDVYMDTVSDGDPVHQSASGFEEEGELSDPDHDTATETDQTLPEEQSYCETVCGIRSFMGCTHIPDMENSSSSDNKPFAAPKQQPLGKISVKLCKKMAQTQDHLS